jgi:uncharacterized protein YxeA
VKNIIIGTIIMVIVGITVVTFFLEQHPELTTPERNHHIEEQETQESVPPQQNPVQPIYIDDTIGYSLQNDQLQVTFNKGSDWVLVPVEKEKLYSGEYSGKKLELIENSFILTQNWAAFLYSEGNSLKLKYSLNQGDTWKIVW